MWLTPNEGQRWRCIVASPRRQASSHLIQQIHFNKERGREPQVLATRMHARGIPTMDGH